MVSKSEQNANLKVNRPYLVNILTRVLSWSKIDKKNPNVIKVHIFWEVSIWKHETSPARLPPLFTFSMVRINAKICIKYRKHWKSYVSFQPSGQIRQNGLIWAAKYYSPNWQQFFHIRPMTNFISIFKKRLKSEKKGLPRF